MTADTLEYLHEAGITNKNISAFAERLKAGISICPVGFEDFNKARDISEAVDRLGLEAEKFWMLALFAYDYACDMRSHGVDEELGGHEMMWELIERGCKIVNNESVEPIKVDASCAFKLQGRTYKIKDANSIAVLLYWIHRGMLKAETSDPIWELNWLIDDYDNHLTERTESQSVAIWVFASILKRFFSANKARPRARGNREVSLNKLLLISRLVYLTRMSENDNFLYSDDTIKGFLRQYKGFKLSSRGKFYTGMQL